MLDTVKCGLHVQVGNDVSAVKQDVGALKDGMDLCKVSWALLVFTRLWKLSSFVRRNLSRFCKKYIFVNQAYH